MTNGAPIEFDVTASGDDHLDFANSYLHVKVKIERANGTPLEAGDTVGPVNNLLHSMFSQVDVSLNGTLITNSTTTYLYKAYLESLLTSGPAAKRSQLTSGLFYKDEAGKMDTLSPWKTTKRKRTAVSRKELPSLHAAESWTWLGAFIQTFLSRAVARLHAE